LRSGRNSLFPEQKGKLETGQKEVEALQRVGKDFQSTTEEKCIGGCEKRVLRFRQRDHGRKKVSKRGGWNERKSATWGGGME